MLLTFERNLVLLLLLFLAGTAVATREAGDAQDRRDESPHERLQSAADELIQVIEAGKEYYEDEPERFYNEVRDVLEPVVDFDAFARSVMAVHFRRASPEQRREFSETFQNSLINTYARALLNFEGEEIRVIPEDRPPRDPDRQSVRMEVRTAQGRVYPLTYTMVRGDNGEWLVRNIIVEGINIGLTYRNQFQSAMRARDDLDTVIAEWGDTIAERDPVAAELEE
jgi:phospholipid transport system substrate-binding protein